MSFIDSSTASASPLAAIGAPPGADDEVLDTPEEADQDERLPLQRDEAGTLEERLVSQIDDVNLARYLDTDTLREIGMDVVREFTIDENSRADWKDKAEKAMKFTLQITEEKQFPWPRASNVIYPLMAQASINFAARTYPAVIQNRNVVKGVVWGSDRGTPVMEGGQPKMQPGPNGQPQPVWLLAPGEKQARAGRVGEHMSYQLLSEMKYWEPQTDQLLHQLPIIGGAIRKTFRDTVENQNASLFVSLMNLVWDYNAPSFEAAPRHTEKLMKYPHEILELERAGVDNPGEEEGAWLHYEYGMAGGGDVAFGFGGATGGSSAGDQADPDAPHLFLEQHKRVDLDGDGYAEPYVVTVHERSANVVRIVARYDGRGVHCSDDGETVLRIEETQHYTLIPFLPSIDGGSYPVGFGHLLTPLNHSINTVVNQMIDAGTLQNAGAGFIGNKLGIASGAISIQVGKFIRVDTRGTTIRDEVLPLPFAGPSTVLFQLLGVLMGAGKELASIQDVLTGEAGIANAPPTTVLALIEQGMKVYTAIHKRVYRALASEFDKLFRLNRLYLTEPEHYRLGDEEREIHPDDYRLGGGVQPIADPTMVTDMQRLGRAQLLMSLREDPLVDPHEILMRLFNSANFERPEDLFAPPNPAQAAIAQLQLAKLQAELGELRASTQDKATHALLNLALTRKNATAQEEAFLEQQMNYLRLTIETVNAQTRAAQVDHSFHATALQHHKAEMDRAADVAKAALSAHMAGEGNSLNNLPPGLEPPPQGGFPLAPVQPPPGPDVVGPGSKTAGTPPTE